MWRKVNPNPCRTEEPDCVVRAIAIATGQSWDDVHWQLCEMARRHCTMPSVNWLWEKYLREHGFKKRLLPECPECVTVREFARKHPDGMYIAATGSHVVTVIDGDWWDAWDSGDEILTCYFERGEK